MKKEFSRNMRLGLIVVLGSIGVIAALYYVGSRQRLFGSTVEIKAAFTNVNGLRRGNTVRFTGIDVGTVESVEIVKDTLVLVTMAIDADACRFIRKDALAMIGTDGVMGNKLINITTARTGAIICEGDRLRTLHTVEMDATLRTLNNTNENLNAISLDLRTITEKLNSERSVVGLLLDQSLAENVRSAVTQFRYTGEHTAVLTGDLRALVKDVRAGKGAAGLVLADSSFRTGISSSVVTIHAITDSIALISGNFRAFSEKLKNDSGVLGVLLSDTAAAKRLEHILSGTETGVGQLNSTLSNMSGRWPFKAKKKGRSKKAGSD